MNGISFDINFQCRGGNFFVFGQLVNFYITGEQKIKSKYDYYCVYFVDYKIVDWGSQMQFEFV